MVTLGPSSDRIFQALRQEIIAGALPPHGRLPTEGELCRRFDASRNTVRKAIQRLATDGLVSIRRNAGSHVLPQQVVRGTTNIISLMYSGDMVQLTAIQDWVMAHGCTLCLYSQNRAHWDLAGEARFLRQVLAQRHRALLAFCSPLPPRNDALLEELAAAGTQVIHLEAHSTEIPRQSFLLPDYARAGYNAVTALLLAGCRRVVYMGMDTDGPCFQLIRRGVTQALQDHVGPGATFAAHYVVQPEELSDANLDWLASQFPPGTGVVSGSQARARTLLLALGRRRVRPAQEVRLAAVEQMGDLPFEDEPVDCLVFDRSRLYQRAVDLAAGPDFQGIRELVAPQLVRASGNSKTKG